jgi:serine/threonine protein kinase
MPLVGGSRLGPYEILFAIGAGGMGEVYRARDARLERDVVLKMLPADALADGTARAWLVREARLASNYALAGDKALALEQAYRSRDPKMPYFSCSPIWDPVRSEPRVQTILRGMGLGQ